MQNWKIKLSLFLNYFVFAILLNSVGTVILQVQNNFGVTEGAASILEAFKDLSIAIVSFLISSYITRIGYKNAMLIALAFIAVVCFVMPFTASFFTTKLLFAAVGSCFALIKMSVYSIIGLVTNDEKEHLSLMNFLESFFMVGILSGYFIFGAFVDDAHPGSTSWLKVYYLLGAISVIAFLLLLSAPLDESRVRPEETRSLLEEFGDMIKLAITPLVLVFIASAFIYVMIEQSIMSWLPTFNKKVFNFSTSLSIQMTSILAASTAVGRFIAGVVLRKMSWLAFLLICLLSAGSLLFLVVSNMPATPRGSSISHWTEAPAIAFILPLIGILIAPIYPAINSVILSALPVKKHGLMSGLIIVFSAIGGTTGSILTGHIFQAYGGKTAFYFVIVPITVLVFFLFLFSRLRTKYQRPMAA